MGKPVLFKEPKYLEGEFEIFEINTKHVIAKNIQEAIELYESYMPDDGYVHHVSLVSKKPLSKNTKYINEL